MIMLLQFSVENFQSIRDKVILSLEPSVDKEHPENIVSKGDNRAMNTLAVYGANASGKTALFKALTFSLIAIRRSVDSQITTALPFVPFLFDEESRNKPSAFEYTFVAINGKKYVYGFSAFPDRIVDEYLYVYNTAKPSLIFDRTDIDQYKFPRNLKKEMELIQRRNTPNKFFISTATSWNVEITKPAFEWLASGIDTFTNIIDMQGIALDLYRNEIDGEYTGFACELMHHADINISNIQVEAKELTQEKLNQNPFGIFFQFPNIKNQYEYRITTGHSITDKNGMKKEYPLQLGDESLGTQQLFMYAPILKRAFDSGKVLVIDEIDKSLHPFIVKLLINLFRDSKINTGGAQLIVTTHETPLLSLETFRRDQIYFTEKDADSGVTDLYSLDEFSVRKTDNIEKGYLLGRYGAIPYPLTEEII